MRGLIWKEWAETKNIVAMSALLMGVMFASFVEFYAHTSGALRYVVRLSDLEYLMVFFWCIPAALTAVTMVAPEIGSGTLQLLSSIPLGRRRIWWIKICVAVAVTLLSDLAAYVVLIVEYWMAFKFGMVEQSFKEFTVDLGANTVPGLLISLPIFAFGSVATVLVDNTVTALVVVAATALVAFAGATLLLQLVQASQLVSLMIEAALSVFLIVIGLIWSHQIFRYGESLKTTKRFKLLFDSKAMDIVTILASLIISYAWLVN